MTSEEGKYYCRNCGRVLVWSKPYWGRFSNSMMQSLECPKRFAVFGGGPEHSSGVDFREVEGLPPFIKYDEVTGKRLQ